MDGVLRRESWGLGDMHQSDSGRKLMPLKDSQRWPSSLKKGTPVSQPLVRHCQLIAWWVGVGRFSSSCPLGGWWLLISRGSHGTRCNWPQRRVALPGGTDGKRTCLPVQDAWDVVWIPGLGRSPEGSHGNPFQYSGLENPHGQSSLAGYSPKDCRELDTTEATYQVYNTSLVVQTVKCLPAMWETRVQSLFWEDPLEKEMATHSSTLAWKIPWMEEPGGL